MAAHRIQQVHDAPAGYQKHVSDSPICQELNHVLRYFHGVSVSRHQANILRMPSSTEIQGRKPNSSSARLVHGT